LKLRPYQRDALTALTDYWSDGGDNPLIVMATGVGKSLVQGTLAKEMIAEYSGLRIISVTHVKELIAQNYSELLKIWDFAPAGMYSAGLGQRNLSAQIIFCGIQSIHNKAKQLGWVDLVMVDEAHLIPRNADTMYGRFIEALIAINPDLRVVGFTATPYRTDSGRLDEGDERLFSEIVYDYGIADGIADGYLSRLVSKGTATGFDLSGVTRRGGEYVPGSLQSAVDRSEVTSRAVEEIVAAGQNKRSWLAFCAGVAHAEHVRDEIRSHGVTCETITGDTPSGDRLRWLEEFKIGKIRCLTNNSVLTTGFNAPGVDLIAGLRPTLSAGLYVQIAGRGTRTVYSKGFDLNTQEGRLAAIANGPKPYCLYLDFAGNVRKHGPVDAVEPRKPGKGDGEAPIKECEHCHALVHISLRVCPECGEPFPINEKPKHEATAAVVPVLSEAYREWQAVTGRKFARHTNAAGNESVRVDFSCHFTPYRMWLSIAKAPGRANKFWRDYGGEAPCPADVDEWLDRQDELFATEAIMVRPQPGNPRYTEIVGTKVNREAKAYAEDADIPF
jgi:DNA repair protein RadD